MASSMKAVVTFLIVYCVLKTDGKHYERCELARELLNVHKLPRHQIADWVCIAQHESNFNTKATNPTNSDGSTDHGLFQINDRYWCAPPGPHNECNVNCKELRDDDITDDVRCIKIIFGRHGFDAWVAWKNKCKGRDLSSYISGCGV